MRLKYLTLCLLGLSLSACTQHVIKSTASTPQLLGERASNGINAIFDTSSYDVSGQFSIQSQLKEKTTSKDSASTHQQPSGLDPEFKKQLDLAIKAQNIQLNAQQKNQLYEAIAKEQDPYGFLTGGRDGIKQGVADSLLNILNDLQFSYDGSVHYRQKMANLNLNLKYQKPTLSIQAQLPLIVDLNDFKLYTNYFAFMPFMVNRDSQASYAYIDFSKYKDDINQINIKNLALYLKQLNALPYALSTPNQVTGLDLTAQEKQQGLSSKIRYQGTLENIALQMSLFEWVNTPYYNAQVKGQNKRSHEQAIEQDEGAPVATTDSIKATKAEDATAENSLEMTAYSSATRVAELLQAKVDTLQSHDDADTIEVVEADEEASGESDESATVVDAACTSEDACATSSHSSVQSTTQDDTSALSEQACEALSHAKKVPAGYVTLCREWYGVNVFKPALAQEAEKPVESEQSKLTALEQLKPIFVVYQSEKLMNVQGFKQLWQKHEAEIQQALKQDRADATAFTMDVGLDQSGRLQSFDYDVQIKDKKMGQFQFISHNQISNYGHAKAIDRKLLKNAKSIEEISKGSLLERASKGFLGSLATDQATTSDKKSENTADLKTTDEYLNQIALNTFKRTNSGLITYQTVFGLYATIKQSDLSKHYSKTELNEIAELSAYHFNPDWPKPKGVALTRLNQLAEKHQLKNPDSFDEIGYSVNKIVNEATKAHFAQQEWQKRIKQYKTQQAVFAHDYAERFEQEYELSAEEKRQLTQASQVFAQAFADDVKNKLSEKSIKNMQVEDMDLFDDEIYRAVYVDIVQHLAK
ncbi:hypothetical protein [Acinetobacter celticus]|uniref:Lipoprotein n=1 Tax=Acinetobacter celticus TaxID=1891224 RepID=A0A1C3CTN6_9GAMM|nr:hypothetical protein [Acinetobacter celticus]ODA12087.1 hypothetical protein BBP83_11430 [Acinetobacter celticus]